MADDLSSRPDPAARRQGDDPRRSSDDVWAVARAAVGDGSDDLNIAVEAVDRHVAEGHGRDVAIRWLPTKGPAVDLTYETLADQTNRFASALAARGYDGGHGVATLCGRIPLLYIAALGTLKGGGVYSPLFSAFGPDPIAMRVRLGNIRVLVTTAPAYRRKVRDQRESLPSLELVLLVDEGADSFDDPSVVDLSDLLAAADPSFAVPPTDAEQPALLHFTSGTTGRPKGALHVHEAVVAHRATGRSVLELDRGTVYWCTADPGWVTGTSYGVISPLVNGATAIVDEAEFDAERWYRILQDEQVEVFYTAPTALRMLQRTGDDLRAPFDLSSLQLVASVGEPLDPGSVLWARDVFGVPVLDTWWQTETGAMMIANRRELPVRPGSMGQPLPGVSATILACDADGEIELDADGQPIEITDADGVGEIALEAGWPSMFRTYLDQEERYAQSFAGRWYHSGDLGRRDADGYFWFVGRNNDVIKSAGHLVGPFEVESALVEHPSVAEAGVIGKPDETVGAIVKAFVVTAPGVEADDALIRELRGHARKKLGAAVAPREIEIVADLPHTRSGKIMRRLLKARELGLDEGDTSTLETVATTTGDPS